MLRQVFVFKGKETVYSYSFGTAFSTDTLVQVKERLAEYINEPVEGTVFNRPLFNFQVVYASIRGLFFLFVTDLTDRPDYVKEEIKPMATEFFQIAGEGAEGIKNGQPQASIEEISLRNTRKTAPKDCPRRTIRCWKNHDGGSRAPARGRRTCRNEFRHDLSNQNRENGL